MSTELELIRGEVFAMREPFMAALSDQSINFDAEAGYAVQLLMASDFSMKIARSNPQSVRNAVTNIAAMGISLNPAKKLAYLVPRDGRICLDISYMGLIQIAVDSRSIRWGQARLVHASDVFELNGIDQQPTHRCKPFDPNRGGVVGVYSVAKTLDGDFITETMDISAVFDVRNRSAAWKAWESSKKKCPWVTDEGEMTRKTVIKRAYKYWPKSDRLDRAIDMLNTQNEEGLAADEVATPAQDIPSRSSSPGRICADMAERGLTDDRKHELDDCALTMLDAFRGGNELAAAELYYGLTDNEEKIYIWGQLRGESALRSFIKANQPKAVQAAAEVVDVAVPTNIFEGK